MRAVPPGVGDFRFNYPKAVGDQLVELFATVTPVQLTATAANAVPNNVGVYELFHPGPESLVYVGKADQGLRSRMREHFAKLSGRQIQIEKVFFRGALLEPDYLAVAPEEILISRLTAGKAGVWQRKGFGSNDPGMNRDETVFEADHFDVRFPARFGWPIRSLASVGTLGELFEAANHGLPYTFRVDRRLKPVRRRVKPLAARPARIAEGVLAARDVFSVFAAALPAGWQVTALPGYVICYERTINHPSAVHYWRSDDGGVLHDGPMSRLDPGGVDEFQAAQLDQLGGVDDVLAGLQASAAEEA